MKYSTRLSDALHILAYLDLYKETDGLSSTAIATSIRTNPAYVRQIMSQLKTAGLITVTRGKANAALTREPGKITMCEVYKAVEGDKPLLHLDTHTNPECGIGVNVQFAIDDYYKQIQEVVYKEMASISLADILSRFHERAMAETGACSREGASPI